MLIKICLLALEQTIFPNGLTCDCYMVSETMVIFVKFLTRTNGKTKESNMDHGLWLECSKPVHSNQKLDCFTQAKFITSAKGVWLDSERKNEE